MVTIQYSHENEFMESIKKYHMDKCSNCNNIVEVKIEHLNVHVANIEIEIEEIPLLVCKECGTNFYSFYAQEILYGLYLELKKRGNLKVVSTPNSYKKKFDYASALDFIYDHKDFYSIPGVKFDDEHPKEGFLTPVYFDRKALLYFIADPNYIVNIFSETYGNLSKKDHSKLYTYEWSIPFGFNSNGKLVLWLGDIDTTDEFSQSLLRSFNISSDHLIIDSEFYQAQMNCIFSEPIKEMQIIINKKIFVSNILKKYEINLSHLESECLQQEENINRPIIFNEQSLSATINAFDKILVEGFNLTGLRTLYERLYEVPNNNDYKNWQSIRLLKEILIKLCDDISLDIDIETIISPLYILHDYRIYLDHLLSEREQEKKRMHIANTLGVSSFQEQEKIYLEEIKRLDELFQYLLLLSKQ